MNSGKDKRKSKSDSALHQRSSHPLLSPSLSLLILEIPDTAPPRVERSFDADSVDDESFIPNSTFLEYVGEVRTSDLSSKRVLPTNFENDRRLSLSDVRSDVAFAQIESSTNFATGISPASSPPEESQNDSSSTGGTEKPDSTSMLWARKFTGSRTTKSSEFSDSDRDRFVKSTSLPQDSLRLPEDETLFKFKTNVPASLEENLDIKLILENLQQKLRTSIDQAVTSVSSNRSRVTSSKPISTDEETISNPEYSDDSKPNSQEIRQRMFSHRAPKGSIPSRKSQRKSPCKVIATHVRSTSNNTAHEEKAPPNSRDSNGSASRVSSDKLSTPKSKPLSGSDEVLSEMSLYQREVETWLRKVVEVVKEELETLYENKAMKVKSKTDPESLLKKTSKKKKISSKSKKFPYYPSGVIIPKCRPIKQYKTPDSKPSSKPRFSELFDSYQSQASSTREDYPEIEGEYDECDPYQYIFERPPPAPSLLSNSDAPGYDYTSEGFETTNVSDTEQQYEAVGSDKSVSKAQSSKELREMYVHEWMVNVQDSNNNADYYKKANRHQQTEVPSKQKSNVSSWSEVIQSQSSHLVESSKSQHQFPAPFSVSIEAATQMYEEALRDCKRTGEIFHQNLAEKFTKMHIKGLRRIGIQKKLHDADIRRAVLMESKLTHLRNKSAKRLGKAFSIAKEKVESQNNISFMKMMEAKLLETKGVLKLFKDTMDAERRSILEMKVNQKIRTRKMYAEVNEQISKLESLLQHGTNDLDKISSKLRKTSSLDTIELLNSLHKKGYQQLQNEINKCITNMCSTFLLQK